MTAFHHSATWCAIAVALTAFGAGCGSDEPATGSSGPPAKAEIRASEGRDRQIGLELQDYLANYCQPANSKLANHLARADPQKLDALTPIRLCFNIATITVEDSRVTVRSGLKNDAEKREAGETFCSLMYASDVADSTPKHELQDKNGETIKVCPVDS